MHADEEYYEDEEEDNEISDTHKYFENLSKMKKNKENESNIHNNIKM